jgi:hypothetical protein
VNLTPYPEGRAVVLKNKNGRQVRGKLLKRRSDISGPDIALIQAESDERWMQPYPEISLRVMVTPNGAVRPITEGSAAMAVGFPIDKAEPEFKPLGKFSYGEDPKGRIVIQIDLTQGVLRGGMSGSAAIDSDGIAMGTLIGWPKEEFSAGAKFYKYAFFPTSDIESFNWLHHLAKTTRVETILQTLENRTLSDREREELAETPLRSFELAQLVNAIAAEPVRYQSGIESCKQMLAYATKYILSIAVNEKTRKTLTSGMYLDLGRQYQRVAETLVDFPNAGVTRAETLQVALKSFENYERIAKATPSDYHSNAQYDIALTKWNLYEAQLLSAGGREGISKNLAKSKALKPTNPLPYDLEAKIAERQRNYSKAIEFKQEAVARDHPKSKILLKDIEDYKARGSVVIK